MGYDDKEYQAWWRRENKDYLVAYREANREIKREYDRKYTKKYGQLSGAQKRKRKRDKLKLEMKMGKFEPKPWELGLGHTGQEPRDIEAVPYSRQEQRVAEYIREIAGIGGGDDPVGFLIAAHALLAHELKDAREMRDRMIRQVTAP